LAYAYWVHENFPEVSVFWVHAGSPERFYKSISQIAQNCQVRGHNDPKADVSQLVKAWLARDDQSAWLMILDSADDTEIFFSSSDVASPKPAGTDQIASEGNLAQYIPECSHGSILVTTKNKETGVRLTRGRGILEIGHMDPVESRKLMQEILEDDGPDSDHLDILTARLEYLPLALAQSAAFIQERSMTVARYLHLLDQSDSTLVELLSEPFEAVGRDSSVPNAVAATWMVSFKQIREQYSKASDLLSLMSFFDRQGIPKAFLSYWISPKGSQDCAPRGEDRTMGILELEKALGVLKGFSFVSEGTTDENLNMHRLVQLVMRKWLIRQGTSGAWVGQALITVSALYPPGIYANRKVCEDYLPHACVVLGYEDSSSLAEVIARGSLLHNMALFMLYRGQWNKAEELQVQAVATRRRVLGEEHPDMLASMANLASTYWYQGRWTKAEKLGVQVTEVSSRVLGEGHPGTLASMTCLAATYGNQGRWTEAEKLEVQVIETSKRALGDEHLGTLASMANLASTYGNQGRWTETEKLYVQVMKTSSRVLGEEHPNTLSSMANLASTYGSQGRWTEAEKLEVPVVETRKRVLGDEHPDTLCSMANLASTYWDQGRWTEAEKLGVQVMETRKRVLGDEHPDTLTSMTNLASTYWNQGRWTEAEKLGVQAIETSLKVLGDEHPITLASVANLALTYQNQGRWAETDKLFVRMMETSLRVLGDEHPDTLTSMSNLALTLKSHGRDDEALKVITVCIQLLRQKLCANRPNTVG
jgi:tetratricopeptide (TPR) repeat protein